MQQSGASQSRVGYFKSVPGPFFPIFLFFDFFPSYDKEGRLKYRLVTPSRRLSTQGMLNLRAGRTGLGSDAASSKRIKKATSELNESEFTKKQREKQTNRKEISRNQSRRLQSLA